MITISLTGLAEWIIDDLFIRFCNKPGELYDNKFKIAPETLKVSKKLLKLHAFS